MALEMEEKRRQKYVDMMEEAREEILEIEAEIERELADVKERITVLNSHKEAARQIYEGACVRLGVDSELEEEVVDEFE